MLALAWENITLPYQQVAVICIGHSNRKIRRARTVDIQAKQRSFQSCLLSCKRHWHCQSLIIILWIKKETHRMTDMCIPSLPCHWLLSSVKWVTEFSLVNELRRQFDNCWLEPTIWNQKKQKKLADAQKPPVIARTSAWCVLALDGSCLCSLQEEGANLTQEVMGREGSVSGGEVGHISWSGPSLWTSSQSRPVPYLPAAGFLRNKPKQQKHSIQEGHGWTKIVAFHRDSLTLYMADLKLLCVRQGWNVDLSTRALLQEAHVSPLLAD